MIQTIAVFLQHLNGSVGGTSVTWREDACSKPSKEFERTSAIR